MEEIIVRKPPEKMAGLPVMDQHLSIFRLVSYLFCQSAMIFMGMGQHDPPDVGKLESVCRQLRAK